MTDPTSLYSQIPKRIPLTPSNTVVSTQISTFFDRLLSPLHLSPEQKRDILKTIDTSGLFEVFFQPKQLTSETIDSYDALAKFLFSRADNLSRVFPFKSSLDELGSKLSLDAVDSLGNTIIHRGCLFPPYLCVKPQSDLSCPTEYISFSMCLVAYLIGTGMNPNIQNSKTKRTPLHCAASVDNLPLVIGLLKKGADPTIVSMEGYNVFHTACASNSVQVVSFFLQATSGLALSDSFIHSSLLVQAPTITGFSALELAIKTNSSNVYSTLTSQQNSIPSPRTHTTFTIQNQLLTATQNILPSMIQRLFSLSSDEHSPSIASSSFLATLLTTLATSRNVPAILSQRALHSFFPALIASPTDLDVMDDPSMGSTQSKPLLSTYSGMSTVFSQFNTPLTSTAPPLASYSSKSPSEPRIESATPPSALDEHSSNRSFQEDFPVVPDFTEITRGTPFTSSDLVSDYILWKNSVEPRMKQCVFSICDQFQTPSELLSVLSSPNNQGDTIIDINLRDFAETRPRRDDCFAVPSFTASIIEYLTEKQILLQEASSRDSPMPQQDGSSTLFDVLFFHSDSRGYTPLHAAIAASSIPLASFLLHNTSLGYSALTSPRLRFNPERQSTDQGSLPEVSVIGGETLLITAIKTGSATMLDFVLSEAANTLKDQQFSFASFQMSSTGRGRFKEDDQLSEYSLFLRLCNLEGQSPLSFIAQDSEEEDEQMTELEQMFQSALDLDSEQLLSTGVDLRTNFSLGLPTESAESLGSFTSTVLQIGNDSLSIIVGEEVSTFLPSYGLLHSQDGFSLFTILASIEHPSHFSNFLKGIADRYGLDSITADSSLSLDNSEWTELVTNLKLDADTQDLIRNLIVLSSTISSSVPTLSTLLSPPFSPRGTTLIHTAALHGQTRILTALLVALFVLSEPTSSGLDEFFAFCQSHLNQPNDDGLTPILLAAATQRTSLLSFFSEAISVEALTNTDTENHNAFHHLLASPFIVGQINTHDANNSIPRSLDYLPIVPLSTQTDAATAPFPTLPRPSLCRFTPDTGETGEVASSWLEMERQNGDEMNDTVLTMLACLSDNSHVCEIFSEKGRSEPTSPIPKKKSGDPPAIPLFSTVSAIPHAYSSLFRYQTDPHPISLFLPSLAPTPHTPTNRLHCLLSAHDPHTPSLISSTVRAQPSSLFSLSSSNGTIFHTLTEHTQSSQSPLLPTTLHLLMHLTKHHSDQAGFKGMELLASILSLRNSNGQTAFHLCRSLESLSTLLNGFVEATASMEAESIDESPLTQLLLNSGDDLGDTILHSVAETGQPLMFLYLIVSCLKLLSSQFDEESAKGVVTQALTQKNDAGHTPFDRILSTPPHTLPTLSSLITHCGTTKPQSFSTLTLVLLPLRSYTLCLQHCLQMTDLPDPLPTDISPIAALLLSLSTSAFESSDQLFDEENEVEAAIVIGEACNELRRCASELDPDSIKECVETTLIEVEGLLEDINWTQSTRNSLRMTLGVLSTTLKGDTLLHQALLTTGSDHDTETEGSQDDPQSASTRSSTLGQMIVQRLVDVEATNAHEDTALALATKLDDDDAFRTLVSFGVKLDITLHTPDESTSSTIFEVPLGIVGFFVSTLPAEINTSTPLFLSSPSFRFALSQSDLVSSLLPSSTPRTDLISYLRQTESKLLGTLLEVQFSSSDSTLQPQQRDALFIELLRADPSVAQEKVMEGQIPSSISLKAKILVESWDEDEDESTISFDDENNSQNDSRSNVKRVWRDATIGADDGVITWSLSSDHPDGVKHSLPAEGAIILTLAHTVFLDTNGSFPFVGIITKNDVLLGDAQIALKFGTEENARMFVEIVRLQYLTVVVKKEAYKSDGSKTEKDIFDFVDFDIGDSQWLCQNDPFSVLFSQLISDTSV
ncbi:hypothetical protein BLNAU_935 [Blattamonas nauphoetae]|uniref:Ankyrin repeat protein n=1 Tax=Blattamonas nauphoetae TaxID=2049346 RepID=A0ABQ9YJC6_9EUKA|nr:hypothetical protein BLNAU_935 [Blattamonas nauphoetae]